MLTRNLNGFVSYKDAKDFSEYLKDADVADIVEVSGNVEGDVPAVTRLGSFIRAFRQYHAERLTESSLQTIGYQIVGPSDSAIVSLDGTTWYGVLYLDDPRTGDFELLSLDALLDSDAVKPSSKLIIFYG